MPRFRFQVGLHIEINRVSYRLADRYADSWRLVRLTDNTPEDKSATELLGLYAEGKLVFSPSAEEESVEGTARRRARHRTNLSDLPERRRHYVERALALIRAVDQVALPGDKCRLVPAIGANGLTLRDHKGRPMVDRNGEPKMVPRLALLLRNLTDDLHVKRPDMAPTRAPSVATYYRWVVRYRRYMEPRDFILEVDRRGNRKQLPELVKSFMRLGVAHVRAMKPGSGAGARDVRTIVEEKIDAANAADTTLKLRKPSLTTYHNWWNQVPAYDRAVVKVGKVRADNQFRSVRGHEGPRHALDIVEFDETSIPIFLVDEELGVPLGRVTLAWYIDVYSQYPLGFYVGYEPPSDLVITSALRHAILPKAYVREQYPGILNSWLAGGIMRRLIFDNGLSQHGLTIEQLGLELDIDCQYARVRTPWFKAHVERSFAKLNQLIREMAGYTPPVGLGISKVDYDPKKDAVVGLRLFLYVLHKWIIDEYCQRPHSEYGWTPHQKFVEGTQRFAPEYLDDANRLAMMFGIIREGSRLDHDGVTYEGLTYRSDALTALRRRDGHVLKVRMKVNPTDLRIVHAWDDRQRCWLRADIEERYRASIQGLSLHSYKLCRNHALRRYQVDDPDAVTNARRELGELVRRALPLDLSMRANQTIARALGIGTQNIFDNIGADGQLAQLTGPYEGQRLNPYDEPPPTVPSLGSPVPVETPPSTLGLDPPETAAPKRRQRPVFDADNSLLR